MEFLFKTSDLNFVFEKEWSFLFVTSGLIFFFFFKEKNGFWFKTSNLIFALEKGWISFEN